MTNGDNGTSRNGCPKRLAIGALVAALWLVPATVASGQDLQSQLDQKQAELDQQQARKGVLAS